MTVTTDSGTSTVTAYANNGTHTASQLLTEINGVVSTSTFGELTNFLSSLTVAPSQYVAGEYTAQFAYPDMTIPADMPLHALQSELRVMQELRSAPSPPDMPHSRTDWRLGDHIDRLQRQIDSFDADL